MLDRLVLGSGSLARTIVESLQDQPGRLQVVTSEESRAKTLVDEGIATEVGDPTDEATLREVGPVDVVIVASDDGARNARAAVTARQVTPEAMLVAYTGTAPQESDVTTLEEVADRVIDPRAALTDHLLERIGPGGAQKHQLSRLLRGIDRLAVVTHDNPDPDAIASAVALARLAERRNCETDVCYYGNITHQENRAFVNLLDFELRNLSADDDLTEYDGIALVDHSRPGLNDQLPPDTPVDIVIDHHPPHAPVESRFVDLQSDVGATSTLLVDYLDFFDVPIAEDVATGLLFGIRVDTKEFTREAVEADFEAAARLLPAADLGLLERIESPSISHETFDTIAAAIRNRNQEGSVLTSCVGQLSNRDALAQAADRLLNLEGVSTTLVYGLRDGTIYVSARARGANVDLGEVLRDAFGQIGSAGGHADMAGAQISPGIFEDIDDDDNLLKITESVVDDRFLEALDTHTDRTVTGIYMPDYDADEYLAPDETLPVMDGSDGTADESGTDSSVGDKTEPDDA